VIDDLFIQAQLLATIDQRRPKQANLRRAISAAYYAMFHCLIHEATSVQIGTQHRQAPFRRILGRAFTHSMLKHVCTSFGGGALKSTISKRLPAPFVVPQVVKDMSNSFVELQEKRHLADYDLTERFDRSDTLNLIDQARRHTQAFQNYQLSDEKRFFLACLWAWKELTSHP